MPHLRLAAAQLNTVVGDLSGNVERILGALAAAEAAGADICVVPELAIPGYPPEDLLLKPAFVADNLAALEKVAAATGQCAAVVGYVGAAPGGEGLANAAAVCAGGRVVGVYRKRCLPNYGVFDEQRWFVAGRRAADAVRGGRAPGSGVSICEDVWFADGPVAHQAARRRRRAWSTSTPRPTRGRAASAWPCWASGWPRRAAPSPTSTRSAARTSWSSTAPRSSWRPTGRWWPRARQFARGPGGGGHPRRRGAPAAPPPPSCCPGGR